MAAGHARVVRDVVGRESQFAYVHADQPLSLALKKMGDAGLDILPVVSRADIRQLLGIVTLPETLNAYGLGRNDV
jgi:CBS domain-containing protein